MNAFFAGVVITQIFCLTLVLDRIAASLKRLVALAERGRQ